MPEGPMNARRYLDSLRDDCEVWTDGRRVSDVTTEPAFREMIAELARIYDLQNSPEYRDEMTCIDPDTRQRISVSWLFTAPPRISRKSAATANCGTS
jgi:aromatic ring hydroxylase